MRKFDSTDVELLYVACGDGSQYLIPTDEIDARSALVLGPSNNKVMPQ